MSVIYLNLGCGGQIQKSSLSSTPIPRGTKPDMTYAFEPGADRMWSGADKIKVYECAAWVRSGYAHLSMNADPNLRTIVPKNVNYEIEPDGAGVVKKRVKTLDLPYWMQHHLEFEDTIVCKMSIEGAEYELLESLCKTKDKQGVRLIDYFNQLFVEFNGRKMKEEFRQEFVETERWIRSKCSIEIQPWSAEIAASLNHRPINYTPALRDQP